MHKRPIFASRTKRPLQSYPRMPSEVAAIETDAPGLPLIDVHLADVSCYATRVARQRRQPLWLGPFCFALAVLHAATLWSRRPLDSAGSAFAVFYLVIGVAWLMATFQSWRTFRNPIENLDGARLILNDDGIASDRLGSFLPWRVVRRALDLGDAIAIVPLKRPAIVIPKASLPDGGTALWAFLEDRLVGKRMLQRSPSRSATILNTGDMGMLSV